MYIHKYILTYIYIYIHFEKSLLNVFIGHNLQIDHGHLHIFMFANKFIFIRTHFH